MIYRLIALTGPLKGNRITVEQEPMTIGRDPDCTVCIADNDVAGKHAVVEHSEEHGLLIRDLGSMNKILVNKHEVRELRLQHGDIIEIGRTRFLVQAAVEADVKQADVPVARRHVAWARPAILAVTCLLLVVAIASVTRHFKTTPETAAGEENPDKLIEGIIASNTTEQAPETAPGPAPEPPAAVEKEPEPVEPERPVEAPKPAERPQRPEPPNPVPATVAPERPVSPPKPSSPEPSVSPPKPPPRETPVAVKPREEPAKPPEPKPPEPKPAEAVSRLKIASVDMNRFPASEDCDEMRMLVITLQQGEPLREIRSEDVRVAVTFFDQNTQSQAIVTTAAIVPKAPLIPPAWGRSAERTVTATYLVPRGSRPADDSAPAAERFYGYLVRLYYKDTLVDEDARPKPLLHYSSGTVKKVPVKVEPSSGGP